MSIHEGIFSSPVLFSDSANYILVEGQSSESPCSTSTSSSVHLEAAMGRFVSHCTFKSTNRERMLPSACSSVGHGTDADAVAGTYTRRFLLRAVVYYTLR